MYPNNLILFRIFLPVFVIGVIVGRITMTANWSDNGSLEGIFMGVVMYLTYKLMMSQIRALIRYLEDKFGLVVTKKYFGRVNFEESENESQS